MAFFTMGVLGNHRPAQTARLGNPVGKNQQSDFPGRQIIAVRKNLTKVWFGVLRGGFI
jgi:hypothetical protein